MNASSPGLGFNRWLVPPAALAIHLCIGMAYGFSVFWLPLTRLLGVEKSVAAPADTGMLTMLFTTQCDWRISDVTVLYTLFFVFLGSAAAIWGGWLERVGPAQGRRFRRDLLVRRIGCLGRSACTSHQLWLMWLGSGVLGGIGLGLGYISPVSTLIKWFPDRRGMATGMAIMGFGGGAHDRVAAGRQSDERISRRRRLPRRLADLARHGASSTPCS